MIQALARAKRIVRKHTGLDVRSDELESEIGWHVSCAALAWHPNGAPFAHYAARCALNGVLAWMVHEAARKQACRLLGWLDVYVRDDARLPLRRALRDLVADLPEGMRSAATTVWLRGEGFEAGLAKSGLSRREFSALLDAAAVQISKTADS